MKSGKFSRRALRVAVEALEVRKLLAGTVTGVVYEDANGNGIRDGGEAGVSGRTVFADLNRDFTFDAGEPTATTNATGNYTLTNVTAGAVNIQQTVPDGFDVTAPGLGVQRVLVVDNQTTTATPFGSRARNDKVFLDPNFGTQGESVISVNGINITGREIVQLNDGKFLVAGARNGIATITRFNENGSLDTSFGNGTGFVQPSVLVDFVIQSMALTSDQRIVLGGTLGTSTNFDMAILTSTGALDTTFSGDGLLSIDFGGMDEFRDLAVAPSGRIYLVGRRVETEPVVQTLMAAVTPNGTLDPLFSQDGKAVFTFTGNLNEPQAIAMESDNQAVIAGYRTLANKDIGLVFRVDPSGEIDNSYGSGGTRTVELTESIRLNDVAIDASDRALAAGGGFSSLVTRLTTLGNIDTSFAGNGRNTLNFEGLDTSVATKISLNASGQIGVGSIVGTADSRRFGFYLLTSAGQLDTRYMRNGGLTRLFDGSTGPDLLGGIFLRADNKIVSAGTIKNGTQLGLMRSGDIVPRGSISGTVFNDLNNNGVRDVGEPGAEGRVVFLDIDESGQRDTGEPFATTNAAGNYVIDTVIPDVYTMLLTAPPGFEQSFPAFDTGTSPLFPIIFPGQSLGGQDFGLHEVPPIIETNANGPYTVGEGGSVQLNGSASGAPITVYEWDFDYDGVTFTVDSTIQNPLFSAANLDGPLTRTVALRARSGSFPVSPIATATLTVNNIAPTATFGNNGPITAGQTGTVSFTAQNDPSAADRAAGYRYSFDFNNDGTIDLADVSTASVNVPLSFTLFPGTLTVKGIIKDKDNAVREYTTAITINQGAPPGSISGVVFNDLDADGVRDAGEPGIAGRTIFIDQDNDSVLDTGEVNIASGADGTYTLANIPAGTFNVRHLLNGAFQTLPAGNGGRSVTVASNQATANINFATTTLDVGAKLRGTVFIDTDRDGIFDTGELGAVRTVYLDTNNNGALDAGETSTISATDGTYAFNGLYAGTYRIRQVLETGFVQTAPAANAAITTTVALSQTAQNLNFGTNTTPPGATIRGTVYLDTDRDGVFDTGETGVSGRTVYLDLNNNSVLNSGEPSGVTNANGVYEFTGLAAGTYKIRQILPSGFVQTIPLNNFGNNATVVLGQVLEGINFGTNTTLTPVGATIRGTVFLDVDRDGVFDSGETGVSGRTVYLDLDNDSALDGNERSTTTNSSGVYEFGGLAAGTYKIRQVLPAGFVQTTPSNNFGNNATVSGTQVVTGKNFGTAQNTAPTGGTIRGTVWNDVDRDRNFDSGESGIAGRTVYIDLDNDNVKDGNEPSTVTNSSGAYQISGLAAGTYKVRQILPSGFSQTLPTNGFGHNVTLSTNQTKSGFNFGSAANASRIAAVITTSQKLDSISKSIFAEELIA